MPFIMLAAAVFLSEALLKKHMERVRTLTQRRHLAGGKIILQKYYNTGAAGNLLKNHPKMLLALHAGMLVAVSFYFLFQLTKKGGALLKTGLALLVGGGASNLSDRIRCGHVVDYVGFGFGPKRFRRLVFNSADFCVFLGTMLVTAYMAVRRR